MTHESLIARFNEDLFKRAIRCAWLKTFVPIALAAIIAGALFLVAGAMASRLVPWSHNLGFLGLAVGVCGILVFWGGTACISYSSTIQKATSSFQQGANLEVAFSLDAVGLQMVSPTWQGTIKWADIKGIVQCKEFLLLQLGGARIRRVGDDRIRLSWVFGEEDVLVQDLLTLWRLPVFWLRPNMQQIFLPIPTEWNDGSSVVPTLMEHGVSLRV